MFKFYFNEQIHEVSHKQVINPKKEDYANHMHTYCEMILFLSGDVDYNIDGNIYKPKEDDLMFIPKDTYHCLMPKVDTVYENYVLSFSADVFTSEEYKKIFSYPLVVNIKDDPLISDFFQKLDLYNELFSTDDFKNGFLITPSIELYSYFVSSLLSFRRINVLTLCLFIVSKTFFL